MSKIDGILAENQELNERVKEIEKTKEDAIVAAEQQIEAAKQQAENEKNSAIRAAKQQTEDEKAKRIAAEKQAAKDIKNERDKWQQYVTELENFIQRYDKYIYRPIKDNRPQRPPN